MKNQKSLRFLLLVSVLYLGAESSDDGFCKKDDEGCQKYGPDSTQHSEPVADKRWEKYLKQIDLALKTYEPCYVSENCTKCHLDVIKSDLAQFKDGITSEMIASVASKGTKYQIIDHKLYRQKDCMFPGRCSGIEYFLKKLLKKLPNLDLIINTRDWPQLSKHFSKAALPIFSFSKTSDYYDITYPAWSFWEGGPAIKLYPKGLGQWGEHCNILKAASELWPWDKKHKRAFFRGSRTSAERDPLVLLSRERPELVDAQYTKNQAWKSDADTLNAPPAEEVSLKDHCKFRFLFNFRGVAASFRFKHLFLCGSLVFHVGNEWTEFFYHKMKPWVHYIPVNAKATKDQIRELIEFAMNNDDLVWEIAERGRFFIENHLRMKDVTCYWSNLLKRYAKLLKYEPTLDPDLILLA